VSDTVMDSITIEAKREELQVMMGSNIGRI